MLWIYLHHQISSQVCKKNAVQAQNYQAKCIVLDRDKVRQYQHYRYMCVR